MERWILYAYLGSFALDRLINSTLNELDIRFAAARTGPEHISEAFRGKVTPEQHRRAIEYTLAYDRFARATALWSAGKRLGVVFLGMPWLLGAAHALGSRLPAWTRAEGILFLTGIELLYWLLNLPDGAWSTFVIEERFGFNRMTGRLFALDALKELALDLALGVPYRFCALWLMERGGPFWWVWAFLALMGYKLVMSVVYPSFIEPWFNTFEPLPEGELKGRVLELARRAGFRFEKIFVMDGSRRSGHSNAYFTGFGRFKRIVFYDTMIAERSPAQNAAVFCHELGHWKLKHVLKGMPVAAVLAFADLYLLDRARGFGPLYAAFGLPPSPHAALALFNLVLGQVSFLVWPIFSFVSRRHERAADRFAKEMLGGGGDLAEALVQGAVKNLSNPVPHPWCVAYYSSHPPTQERVAALRAPA